MLTQWNPNDLHERTHFSWQYSKYPPETHNAFERHHRRTNLRIWHMGMSDSCFRACCFVGSQPARCQTEAVAARFLPVAFHWNERYYAHNDVECASWWPQWQSQKWFRKQEERRQDQDCAIEIVRDKLVIKPHFDYTHNKRTSTSGAISEAVPLWPLVGPDIVNDNGLFCGKCSLIDDL